MPVPQHRGKQRHPAVVTGPKFAEYLRAGGPRLPRFPSTVVLGFSPRLARSAARALGARAVGGYPRLLSIGSGPRRVGYLEARGVGGPTTAIALEELGALGVRRFVIVGFAGALQPGLGIGSTVRCRRAIRDEGTSHHYARSGRWAYPAAGLTRSLERWFRARGLPVLVGDSWTTDAPYRETAVEVRRYRREGVLTVEMEASALFTVARARGLESAAVFAVSDQVSSGSWRPAFDEAGVSLERLLALTVAGLQALPHGRGRPRTAAGRERRAPQRSSKGKVQ